MQDLSMPELIFEIGTEEIPADDLIRIPARIKRSRFKRHLKRIGFECSKIETFATPAKNDFLADLRIDAKGSSREQRTGPAQKGCFGCCRKSNFGSDWVSRKMPEFHLRITLVSTTPKGEYLSLPKFWSKAEKPREVLAEINSGNCQRTFISEIYEMGFGGFCLSAVRSEI